MYNVMAMNSIIGNKKTLAYLYKATKDKSLSHAYLFCGPESVGKTKAALNFAKKILCEGGDVNTCTDCPSCKLFNSGNHPDFFHLENETVPVDEIRELVSSLELRPYRGKGKVALVSHAEKMTTQALNAFLKTLEEPTNQTTIILTTENKKNLLSTIVSRTRIVNFGLVPEKEIFEYINSDLGVKKEEAQKICSLAAGRAGAAISLCSDGNAITDLMTLAKDFNRAYTTADIHEKIAFADILAKDKDLLISKLQVIELSTRENLLKAGAAKDKVSRLVVLLDSLTRARDLIKQNANTKLVIEGLLLGSLR